MASSDAYMELSDPAVWGETFDEQFGMGAKGRKLGAFEISKFDFDVSSDRDEDSDASGGHGHGHAHGGHGGHGGSGPSGKGTTKHKDSSKGSFTISKYIDKASPDLFLACCKKDKIQWGIITVRETGEVNRKPYLVIEFGNLHVTSFKWDLSPGESESAAGMETIQFDCETILMKYSRQDPSGEHKVVKMKGWNWQNPEAGVSEIDAELQAEAQEDY